MTKEEYSIQKVLGTLTYEQRVRSRKNQKKYNYKFRCYHNTNWEIYLYMNSVKVSTCILADGFHGHHIKDTAFKNAWFAIIAYISHKIVLEKMNSK